MTAVLAPDQPPPRDTLVEARIVPMGVPGHTVVRPVLLISVIWDSSFHIREVNPEFGALAPGIGTPCPNPFTVKATYLFAS